MGRAIKDGTSTSVQDRYAPQNRCFGCGAANEKGLRIKSHELGDSLVARWQPEPHHEAYAGMLSGGIIGALLDSPRPHLKQTSAPSSFSARQNGQRISAPIFWESWTKRSTTDPQFGPW